MTPVALSDSIAVGEVPTGEQIAILANAGFRSLLNTQPEGEVERHLASAQCHSESEKVGLAYRHIPIVSRRPSDREIAEFARAVAEMPRPIYACCYSGSRTAAVWALAAAETQKSDAIVSACSEAGYDISFLQPELERRYAAAHTSPAVNGSATPAPTALPPAQAIDVPAAKPAGMPQLVPSGVIIPRTASSGGFAIAG